MLSRWRRRRRLEAALEACSPGVLKNWLKDCRKLTVNALRNTPILAVDFELTGLDPKTAEIIAIGWTRIANGRILMRENRHVLVKSAKSVGHSATIHELLDKDIASGNALHEALEELFQAARQHVFLFHHAGLDGPCLQTACQQWMGCRPPLPVFDTMHWEMQRLARRNQTPKAGALRLGALREQYHLPEYKRHDALRDAVATAELFLAMCSQAHNSGDPLLSPLLRWV